MSSKANGRRICSVGEIFVGSDAGLKFAFKVFKSITVGPAFRHFFDTQNGHDEMQGNMAMTERLEI